MKAGTLAAGSTLLAIVALAALYSLWAADDRSVDPAAEDTDDPARRVSTTVGLDEPKPLDEGTDFSCEQYLSQVASSSLVLAEQLPRRIRAYLRTLATRGFGRLEVALVAEAAGRRCISPSCYGHIPLGDFGPLQPLDETYSLPPTRTPSRGSSEKEARDLRTVAEAVAANLSTLDFVLLLDDVRPDLNATWRDSRTWHHVNLATFAAQRCGRTILKR